MLPGSFYKDIFQCCLAKRRLPCKLFQIPDCFLSCMEIVILCSICCHLVHCISTKTLNQC